MMIKKSLFLFFLFSTLIWSCKVKKTLSNLNIAPVYNPENSTFNLQYWLNHYNENESEVKIFFNADKLLYYKDKNDSSSTHLAQYTVKLYLYKDLYSEQVLDSTTLKKTIKQYDYLDTIKVNLPCKLGENYWLVIKVSDLKRSFDNVKVFPIYKKYLHHPSFFSIDSSFKIQHCFRVNSIQNLNIQHFTQKNNFIYVYPLLLSTSPAQPPFSIKNKSTDNFQLLKPNKFLLNDSGKFILNSSYSAVLLKIDTNQKQGTLIYTQKKNFPEYNNINSLIEPLIYLMKPDEFEAIKKSNTKKIDFENFWLKNNQMEKEKARKAIKNFYDKITYANLNFTTFKDGWKTDKGMMYIIKGLPQSIRINHDREIWYYGETSFSEPEVYVFRKVNWEIYNNHFVLDKNFDYKYTWEKNVQLIKEGRL